MEKAIKSLENIKIFEYNQVWEYLIYSLRQKPWLH